MAKKIDLFSLIFYIVRIYVEVIYNVEIFFWKQINSKKMDIHILK